MTYEGRGVSNKYETVYASRACTILFNFLKSIPTGYHFYIPANICPIVPITFLKAKTSFTLIDISKLDFSIDHEALLSHIEKSRDQFGILYSRPYGHISDTSNFFSYIKSIKSDSIIIDDRCLCMPDFSTDSRIDKNIDLELYSTGKSKMVDIGSGGFGHVKNTILYKPQVLQFEKNALTDIQINYELALNNNSRLDSSDTNWLDTNTITNISDYRIRVINESSTIWEHKKRMNAIYQESLPEHIQLNTNYQNWRFNIFARNKNLLIKEIFEKNLFASGHYRSVACLFELKKMPATDYIYEKIINLFNDRYFTEDQALRIAEIIKKSKYT